MDSSMGTLTLIRRVFQRQHMIDCTGRLAGHRASLRTRQAQISSRVFDRNHARMLLASNGSHFPPCLLNSAKRVTELQGGQRFDDHCYTAGLTKANCQFWTRARQNFAWNNGYMTLKIVSCNHMITPCNKKESN